MDYAYDNGLVKRNATKDWHFELQTNSHHYPSRARTVTAQRLVQKTHQDEIGSHGIQA